MAGLALDVDAQGERLVAADDDADIAALAVEVRRLLDVQLEIAVERAIAERRLAGIADPLELIAEAQARVVLRVVHLRDRQLAGERQRSHQRRAEAGAFLIGPHDQFDRPARLDGAVVERPDRLQAAHDPEHAVIASATDLGVEMAADGDRGQAVISPRASGEDISDRVDLDGAACLARPANEQIAHLLVLPRERQPAQPGIAEAADLAGPLDRRPQPFGVDLEGIGWAHGSLPNRRAALAQRWPGEVDLARGGAQAARHVLRRDGELPRHGSATAILIEAAAQCEAAPLGKRTQVGRHARDCIEPAPERRAQHRRGQQRSRVWMRRGVDHRLGRADLDEAAGIHDGDAVGDLDGDTHVVRDEDDGHAQLLLQLAQQQDDLDLHRHVERCGRLVGQQHGRTA